MGADEYDADALIALYEAHPCNARSVLHRLGAGGRLPAGLTPGDLAADPHGHRTDQNHVGAAPFVEALAAAAGIDAASAVLDLGCGLGGSARLLAARYGCRVDGLDISPRRVDEGNELTRLVGLQARVTLHCADLRDHPIGEPRYTHLWGQGAWVHIGDKHRVLQRWLGALRPGGRVAMEDSYLRREPLPPEAAAGWQRLSEIWMAKIPSLSGWRAVFEPPLRVAQADDLTPALIEYFSELTASAVPPRTGQARRERDGWRLAVDLAQTGVLGYLRLVAEHAAGSRSEERGDP